MKPLRILITNWTMEGRHGSVMYVADLARELFRRGHQPVVYAPKLGEVAEELRAMTIAVTDSLANITDAPDIIIGNTHPDAMAALLRFPGVPAIFVLHAWDVWLADAPKFSRIRHYIAVDETCRDWLQSQKGVPGDKISVIQNSVDLDLFPQRPPLPARPLRAAVFSNYINETNGLPVIREACRRAGVVLDVIGAFSNTVTSKPGDTLQGYDLVFGKARCALEAMACGCAVIACDYGRLGGMVTAENWQALRRLNFGRRAIQTTLTIDALVAEIRRYDADDARAVSMAIRASAGLELSVAAILKLCERVLEEFPPDARSNLKEELCDAADYVTEMNRYNENHSLCEQLARSASTSTLLRAEVEQAARDVAFERAQLAQEITARSQAVAMAGSLEEQVRIARNFFEHPIVRVLRGVPGVRFVSRKLFG